MAQVNEADVQAIRDWLAKESHLPKNFDDIMLKKFLFSCFCSLEKTKQCINNFCTYRTNLPEVHTNRDPASTKIQNAFSFTRVASYMAGVDEILIHQVVDTSDIFDFYGGIKSFTLQADHWLGLPLGRLPEGHVVVIDIKLYTLSIIPRVNVFYYQKFLVYLLESMPVRLKQVHVVNCPSYYEYFYNLVKGAFPQEIQDMVKFHPDTEGLHEYIDKKYLPEEFGGDAQSIEEQHAFWAKEILGRREFFMNDNVWKANLEAKVKTVDKNISMNGSFKALAID